MIGSRLRKLGSHFSLRLTALLVCSLLRFSSINGQLNIEGGNQGIYTPEELIEAVFLGSGVTVQNVNYVGNAQAVGSYSNLSNYIPIKNGLVITTGAAFIGQNQNNSQNAGALWNDQTPDADLAAIASDPIEDVAFYEITFIPEADKIAFKYAMASEEYPEYACTDFNDVFGLFLSGPKPSGDAYMAENIAWIPDPSDPSGLTFTNIPVSINSINGNGIDPVLGCQYDFTNYYNIVGNGEFPTYDAFIDPFWALADVIPCETYTIKIGVADVSDDELDTAIFLEGKSFSTNQATLSIANNLGSNTIVEGCNELWLELNLPFPLDEQIFLELGLYGNAEMINDFSQIDPMIAMGPGQNSQIIVVNFFEDGITEGTETLGIVIEGCSPDTLWLNIIDSATVDPEYPSVLSACGGPIQITPGEDISQNNQTFSSNQSSPIPFINNSNDFGTEPLISSINVQGLEDFTLVEENILEVCVDISHELIGQIDLYLRSPYGKTIELSTNNGGGSSNLSDVCFSMDALLSIRDAPPPYVGSYLPEVSFLQLNESNKDVNGIWDLIVKDNVNSPLGQLNSWSITFRTEYQPIYTWTPATDLSCSVCPNPIANPAVTTSYTVNFDDPYGCPQSINLLIERELSTSSAISQELDCPGSTDGFITAEITMPGTPPYQFDWGALGTDSIVGPVGAGVYSVTIIDATGCTAEQEVTLSDPDSIQVNFESTAPCFPQDPSGFIIANPMNGQSPYQFQWGSNANNSTSDSISSLLPGTYELTVTDLNGCSVTNSYILEEGNLELELSVEDVSCFGGNDGSLDFEISGGTEPYDISLFNSDGEESPILFGLSSDIYDLQIIDNNGCEIEVPGIEINQPDSFYIDLGEDRTIYLGERPLLDIEITSAQGNSDTWVWNWNEADEEFLTCLNCSFPRVQDLEFPQTFELTIMDSIGCSASDFVLIRINKPRRFFVPTGFTPNDDNNNDLLLTHGDESAKVLQFTLYDRWGDPVFIASDFMVGDPTVGWDGRQLDGFANAGVYVWVAQVEFRDGVQIQFNGESTLIR